MFEYSATIGRVVVGLYFLAAGAAKILGPAPEAQLEEMTAQGIPAAGVMFVAAGASETIAGICLIIGLHVRLVALLLAAFCILVSVMMHAFWQLPAGPDQTVQMIMFLKNMATMGGLLAFAGLGSGPLSVDRLFNART